MFIECSGELATAINGSKMFSTGKGRAHLLLRAANKRKPSKDRENEDSIRIAAYEEKKQEVDAVRQENEILKQAVNQSAQNEQYYQGLVSQLIGLGILDTSCNIVAP